MKNDLVSVIIPVYNDIRFLKEAIESVFNQTNENFEIVLVDDGSNNSNDIETIAKRYSTEKLKYIRNPKNVGLAASRNVGIRHSSGEFVCFLDADDVFAERKFEIQIQALKEDPFLLMVFSNEYLLKDGNVISETNIVKEHHLLEDAKQILYHYAERSFIAVFTVMTRRVVFERVGYFEETLRAWEDDDFWFRIMLEGKVKFSDYTSGYRRLHDSNMSSNRHAMNYFALRTFHRWTKLSAKVGDAELKKIVKRRAYSYFKIYVVKGVRVMDFKPEVLWLAMDMWIS